MNMQEAESAIAFRNKMFAKKRQLEGDILSLVKAFQMETGLNVADIEFTNDVVYSNNFDLLDISRRSK
jgi:hypothetical protein